MSNGEAVAAPGDGALSNSVAGIREEVMNHPAGLFVLFFTEMWERFSYYGMRALLVLFLIAGVTGDAHGGWGWSRADAVWLLTAYGSLVYLTPLFGGFIADKMTGRRRAVVIGALLMTLGHGSLALEWHWAFYLGLVLLILGNGMFKPNISSMVGGLYKGQENKKDSAYTIFYMGINAGAFLGILLCGYVGEKVGWHYGFGLAGIFMLFGLLQFHFSKNLFGQIGAKDDPDQLVETLDEEGHEPEPKVVRERLYVVGIFAFFTIFFWMAFEQAAGSMTIFAESYTERVLSGNSATIFTWIDTILTVVPILIVSIVLYLLVQRTFKHIPLSNILLATSFLIIWGIVIWKIQKEFSSEATEVPATWFGILNSFFIIALAPLFSKFWAGKGKRITGPGKFSLGLILLGIGFGFLAYGASGIPAGAETAAVSMFWLIMAYFFHTVGELCLSPVGLSYVNKLSPKRLMSTMFGIWFLSSMVAHLLAGATGSQIDTISAEYSLSGFFLIFTAIPVLAGIIMFLLKPKLVKWMHGIH